MSTRRFVALSTRRASALTLAAGAVLSLGLAGQQAAAQTWIGTASGNFSVGTNWDGGIAPVSSATTLLTFTGSSGSSLIATNNIANPFQLNGLTLAHNFTGGLTLNSLAGTDQYQFTGTSPAIVISGLGNTTMSSSGGLLSLSATTSVSGSGLGNLTLAGVVSGAGGLSISGTPATQISRVVALNAINTFGGGVTLDGGNLSLGNNAALGTGGLTVGAGGGTLAASTAITGLTGGNITLNGTLKLLGTNSFTLVAPTITGAGNLTMQSSAGLTVQSPSNSFTGVYTAERSELPQGTNATGSLTLSGVNGSMTGATAFNIGNGSTLTLTSNSAGTTNANRVGDSAEINLRGGNFSLTGTASGGPALTETVGALTGAGYGIVTAANGASSAGTTIQAASLARADRGTFLFRGSTLGASATSGQIKFTASPAGDLVGGGGLAGTQTISILPYAIGDASATGTGNSFVTYDPVLGIRPLNTGTEYASNLTSGSATNARLTAATANNAAVTVNSLALTSGITGTGTITLGSGALLIGTSSAISNNIDFGSAEGQVFSTIGNTISGNLTGSNGLTKSGTSTLTLTGTNTGLTGQLTINAGRIHIGNGAALPGTGQIVMTGTTGSSTPSSNAGLSYTGASPLTISRDINLTGSWIGFDATGGVSAPLTLSGNLSGPGGIVFGGSSASSGLVLSGNNASWSGPIRINEGRLTIGSDANLGTGALDLWTGTSAMGAGGIEGVQITGNWTTSRHINFTTGSGVDVGAFAATFNGPLTGTSGFTKIGSGNLRINSANTLAGSVIIGGTGLAAGDLTLGNDGALNSTTYTASNGANRLVLDNSTLPTGTPSGSVTIDRVNNGATVNLGGAGATLLSLGNASLSVREIIATLSLGGSSGNILQVESSGSQVNTLQIGNLTMGGGGLLVRGTNLGGLTGSIGRVFLTNFNGVGVSNGQILTGVTAESLTNLGVIEQGVYDTAVGIRLLDPVVDFTNGVAIQNAAPTSLPTTANFRVNTSVADPVPVFDAANTINALRFGPGGNVDYSAGVNSVLTITSGSLFTEAGGAATITVGGPGTLTITSGATTLGAVINSDLTSAAAIGGTGGLLKSGLGTLTLTGGASNTGTLTVNGGTLAMNSAGTFGPLSVGPAGTLSIGGSLTAGGSAASSIAGTLSGAGSLTYAPTTVQTLTVASTANVGGYTGDVTVGPNGRLQLNSAGGLGTGTVTLNNTSDQTMVNFNAGNVTVPTNFTLGPAAVVRSFSNSTAGQTTTLSGKISGGAPTATFRVTGPSDDSSTIVLTNAGNDFQGLVSVFEGVLAITSDAALGNPNNDLSLNTTTSAGGGLRFDAPGIVLNANRTVTFVDSNVVNTQGFSAGIDGVIAGTSTTSTFTKSGAGTLTISGNANTIVTPVAVAAGTLLVNGNLPGNSTATSLTVAVGATLGGDGTIGSSASSTRNVTVNGTLSPGSSAGDLQIFGNLSFTSASAYMVELNGPVIGSGYDSVTYSGSLSLSTIGAGVALSTSLGYTPTLGDVYWIAVDSGTGSVTGTFAGLLEGDTVTLGTFAGDTWTAQISYAGNFDTGLIDGSGNDIVLYNVVPAPGAVGLLGMAGLLAARRRRR
jgi:autotransporter-associated beta strand protein